MKKISNLLSVFWDFLKRLGTRRPWVSGVSAFVVIVIIGYALFAGNNTDNQSQVNPDTRMRIVTLIPVSEFTELETSQLIAGQENVVRSETSGKITQVVPVGSRISRGNIIAVFENAAQQAALLQAEGALEAAEASLEKTEGGLRSEQIAVLQTAVESAENNAVATLLSAYATINSALRNNADQMLSNPESNAPKLNFASSNNQRRIQIENNRVLLQNILVRQAESAREVSTTSDLSFELDMTDEEVREVRAFIDTLIAALNEAIPTGNVTPNDISNFRSAATSARTALDTTLSSIASSRGSLETTRKNLEEGLAGAEDTDIRVAVASLKQAQGAYDSALAAYQKTIVRAPVSGTVASCNAEIGDVLSIGADICRIRTSAVPSGSTFTLPLTSVKYTPAGAFVFSVNPENILEAIVVETGLVTAGGITVTGLLGDEFIVDDVRGLKAGEVVTLE